MDLCALPLFFICIILVMVISHLFSIEGYLPNLVVTCICITNTKLFVKLPTNIGIDNENSQNKTIQGQILEMEMLAKHMLHANIGNANSLISIPKHRPMYNPIWQEYIPQTNII